MSNLWFETHTAKKKPKFNLLTIETVYYSDIKIFITKIEHTRNIAGP